MSPPDGPILIGVQVTLRPVGVADAPGLVELLGDEDVVRLTATHRPALGLAQAAAYYRSRSADASRVHLAIVERSAGEYVGEVVLMDIDEDNRCCAFRIALLTRATRRGLGTEATRLMVAHALTGLGLHRVELEVLATNTRARHVYEKAGFVAEGVKRDAVRWSAEWIDLETMALIGPR